VTRHPRNGGFDNLLDALQMRAKARSCRSNVARIRARFSSQTRAGLRFLEGEALLLVLVGPELFRLLAEVTELLRFQHRGQPRDFDFSRGVDFYEVADLGLRLQDFAASGLHFRLGVSGVGERQHLEFVNVVGKLVGALKHANTLSNFAYVGFAFLAASQHFSYVSQRFVALELPPSGHASSRGLERAP